jgi:hypothetical protein
VLFYLASGKTHEMNIKADSYEYVAAQVTDNSIGWIGTKGELVNLKNVERVEINESDGKGFPFDFV